VPPLGGGAFLFIQNSEKLNIRPVLEMGGRVKVGEGVQVTLLNLESLLTLGFKSSQAVLSSRDHAVRP
jgi:hypothetical protein